VQSLLSEGVAAVPTKAPAKKSAAKKPHAKKLSSNEAQIAVHWKDEDSIRPPARFIAQANLNDPNMVERFSEKNFPNAIASTRTAALGSVLAHDSRHRAPTVLEMVRRRQTQRQL